MIANVVSSKVLGDSQIFQCQLLINSAAALPVSVAPRRVPVPKTRARATFPTRHSPQPPRQLTWPRDANRFAGPKLSHARQCRYSLTSFTPSSYDTGLTRQHGVYLSRVQVSPFSVCKPATCLHILICDFAELGQGIKYSCHASIIWQRLVVSMADRSDCRCHSRRTVHTPRS